MFLILISCIIYLIKFIIINIIQINIILNHLFYYYKYNINYNHNIIFNYDKLIIYYKQLHIIFTLSKSIF